MEETILIGAQKVIDPPLQVEDDGVVLPIVTKPGGINYIRPGSEGIKRILDNTRLDFGFQAAEERRQRIRTAFFVDQLKLIQGLPQMTATEVLQRTEDSTRLLSPVMGRLQSELLRPMVSRQFEIMLRRDMFMEIPEELAGADLDIQYSSLIAKAQRVSEAQSISRVLDQLSPFIQLDPTVADNLNGDVASRILVNVHGAPSEILRNADQVEELREQREQARQRAIEQQQAQMDADQAAKQGQALQAVSQAGA